jgi:hypothetical protein
MTLAVRCPSEESSAGENVYCYDSELGRVVAGQCSGNDRGVGPSLGFHNNGGHDENACQRYVCGDVRGGGSLDWNKLIHASDWAEIGL